MCVCVCGLCLCVCVGGWVLCVVQGLAAEALAQERLLWKLRPKVHKLLWLHQWEMSRCGRVLLGRDCRLAKAWAHLHGSGAKDVSNAHIVLRWWGHGCFDALVGARLCARVCVCVCVRVCVHMSLAYLGPNPHPWHSLTKVGKVKQFALMASGQLLGRQVLMRWAAYVCVRWLRRLEWYDTILYFTTPHGVPP